MYMSININICAKEQCDRCLLVAKCDDPMSINPGSIYTICNLIFFALFGLMGKVPHRIEKKREAKSQSIYRVVMPREW